MRTLPPTDLRQSLSEHEYMPLLRSLEDGAARVAISMALLTELSALSPPLDRVKNACKVQELAHAVERRGSPKARASSTHSKRFARFGRCRLHIPEIGDHFFLEFRSAFWRLVSNETNTSTPTAEPTAFSCCNRSRFGRSHLYSCQRVRSRRASPCIGAHYVGGSGLGLARSRQHQRVFEPE